MSTSESQFKKGSTKDNIKTNKDSNAVAPPPTMNKCKHTGKKKETKKSSLSVDISKFVQEAKGNFRERYVLDSVIGKGAYGEVSLVIDKITGNDRAMKVIPKEGHKGISNPTITTEIQMLKSLDHPNIIKIYEFYQDDENYYLITEYCSGGELYDRIISMKNFSEEQAAELMKQILSAVTYCHARKIVHR